VDKVTHIDYKQVDTLRRFVDGHGKTYHAARRGPAPNINAGWHLPLSMHVIWHCCPLPLAGAPTINETPAQTWPIQVKQLALSNGRG
jgi:hypothetical protein